MGRALSTPHSTLLEILEGAELSGEIEILSLRPCPRAMRFDGFAAYLPESSRTMKGLGVAAGQLQKGLETQPNCERLRPEPLAFKARSPSYASMLFGVPSLLKCRSFNLNNVYRDTRQYS